MRIYDIITKKKNSEELTKEEINFVIDGFTSGKIPDYQISALLMAICLKGMTKNETATLTMAMAHSGDIIDLSILDGIKVDKHSTGGVGDKATLVVMPIVASLGLSAPKMSGRGLGHTGGTIDKLESIPGYKAGYTTEEFMQIVKETGLCIAGQSGDLAPADKKLYALRDVTATVNSIPLIAASVMSKKLAAGADKIVLDVKVGSGAFMKDLDDAIELASSMVDIGNAAGKETVALITNMDMPLGNAIGNALEIEEVIATLKGEGPKDLTTLCLTLAKEMLDLAGKNLTIEEIEQTLTNGKALDKFAQMIKAQGGGDIKSLNFEKAPFTQNIQAPTSGYISRMNAEGIGIASMLLGAGRETENCKIDPSAGIILTTKTGDTVTKEDTIATLFTSDKEKLEAATKKFLDSIEISQKSPKIVPLIHTRVDKSGIKKL